MAKAITIPNDISMLFFAFYVISNNGRPGLLQTGQKILPPYPICRTEKQSV